jgi:hypothetical protein
MGGMKRSGVRARRLLMTTEIIFIVEESIEGGFEARALAHSIYTEADTLEDIRSMVKDAVQCHFDERDRPKLIRLHIVKDEVMAA